MSYDLHMHSNYSDGAPRIDEIAARADRIGLETIGITDHFWPCLGSRRGGQGLIDSRRREINDARNEYPHLQILDGAEVDILSDGSLAQIAGGLDQFDLIIGSFHWSTNSTRWVSTLARVLERPRFQILGHWDGYLSSYRVEDGEIAAGLLAEAGVAIELSARYPVENLGFLEAARDAGCVFSIGSDAHSVDSMGQVRHLIKLAEDLDLHLLSEVDQLK
jgi:DNA polymerase (family 10)